MKCNDYTLPFLELNISDHRVVPVLMVMYMAEKRKWRQLLFIASLRSKNFQVMLVLAFLCVCLNSCACVVDVNQGQERQIINIRNDNM